MPAHLAPHEQAAFDLLSGVLRDHGTVERNRLRVLVASEGGDLGRDFARLRDLALIEEYEAKPGFFRSLFGGQPKRYVRLTEKGSALGLAPVAGQSGLRQAQSDAEASETVRDQPPARLEAAADLPPAIRAARAKSQTQPAPKSRYGVSDYTVDVGGAPIEAEVVTPASDRLDGLAELIGLIGFEMTPAGRMLAAKRLEEGQRDSEVALEVLVVAVIHAARLAQTGTATLNVEVMHSLITGIDKTFAAFVTAGELGQEDLSGSLRIMRSCLVPAEDRVVSFDDLLSDPLRGMAPSAICPDDVWIVSDLEAETP